MGIKESPCAVQPLVYFLINKVTFVGCKIVLGVVCLSSLLLIGHLGMAVDMPQEDEMKSVVLSIGGGKPDAKELGIRPTRLPSSTSGYYVPKTIRQAVIEMEKMLTPDLLHKIRQETGNDSDFYDRDVALLGVAIWMYQNWRLGDTKSALGAELRRLGFSTQEWMGRVLMESVFEKDRADSGQGVKRLGRRAFVEAQDEFLPLSSPPSKCISGSFKIHSSDLFHEESRWRTGRTIYWVECRDGTKLAYLWEREWFAPGDVLASRLVSCSSSASSVRCAVRFRSQ